ncbi:MAG: hypothetical protein KAJ14_16730 [Candidatus Omnitrophica bacterium]|nr:hypothetical protein [Candidatus Omnitrophota bacterium]
MSEDFDPYIAWEEYKFLEDDFIKYLRYVPLSEDHKNVWSLYLGDLLIRIGSILDSFLKRAMFSSELDNKDEININYYRSLDDFQININVYKDIFNPFYQLSTKKIYELRTFEHNTPFSSWGDVNSNSPFWWKNYNKVKHDRFKNKKEATLKATLEALSGLFILYVMHLDTMPVLVDDGTIKSNIAKDYLKQILLEKEPLRTVVSPYVYAKTRIFGYVFKSHDFDFDESDVKRILSPSFRF